MSEEYDVVVIGGGLAGMSAALTSARLDRKTLVICGVVPGGELLNIEVVEGVPGFPEGVPGYNLSPMAQEQADAAGAEFLTEEADSITADDDLWRVTAGGEDILARAIVIATGAHIAKSGIPGEERLTGKGVSHCATCDGPLLRGKTVVVVGGGDSGMQETLSLTQHVEKVILLERNDALGGQPSYRERILDDPKVEVRYGVTPTEIGGDDGVTHVRIKELASGAESDIDAEGVFVFTGLTPNPAIVKDLVPLDQTGRIRVDAGMRTSVKGICAAGNVREASPHRAAGAMGDGAAAAMSIDRYLTTGDWS